MRNDERRRLREALLDTAEDFHRGGIIDDETLTQITLRHLPEEEREIRIDIPSGPDIRAMREKARLSQAVFARRLNVSTGYVSLLERGVKTPSGPALVLLDLIRRKGIEALS
jgi:putative transcriptional regulator